MIPLRAATGERGFAAVTYGLLIANVAVFLYQWSLDPHVFEQVVRRFGFVPADLHHGPLLTAVLTLFTSMYLHGGVGHLAGNMMFLWAFGPSLEKRLGPVGMIVFYHLGGLLGGFTQYWVDPTATIPMVGASGAISGLLAGFLVLYPGVKVVTLLVVVYYVTVVNLPAWLLIGFWILLQGLYGLVSLGAGQFGGVAWFAHLGGFAGGFVLILLNKSTGLIR